MASASRRVTLPRLLASTLVASFLLLPAGAQAGPVEAEYPVRYIDRPNTLPAGLARTDLSFDLVDLQSDGRSFHGSLGGGYGVTSRLELGLSSVRARLGPSFELTSASPYVAFGVDLSEALDLIPQVQLVAPLRAGRSWGAVFGGLLTWTLSRPVQLWVSPELAVTFAPDRGTALGTSVSVLLQLTERLYLRPGTGFSLASLAPLAPVSFPASFIAGYAAGGAGRVLVDFELRGVWPSFLVPDGDGLELRLGTWVLTASAALYF